MSSLGPTGLGSGTKKIKKRMKQKIFLVLAFFSIAAVVISCGGRSENRKLVEAAAIHEKILDKHDSIYNALTVQKERVDKKLSQLSDSDPDRPAYESMNRSIERSYKLLNSWMEGVVGVPGVEHKHKEGAPHTHDADKERTMEGLSDQEILELQQAYKTRLDEVGSKIKELITTMDMYTKDDN